MVLARWQNTIVDEAGDIQAGASVEVREETGGAPLASIFSDRDGNNALGNPFLADSEGFAAFHVAGGAYRITATKNGFSRVWRYVAIGLGAESDNQGNVDGAAASTEGNLPSFSDTSGKALQDSGIAASDVYRAGGTDVAITDGGTGQNTAAEAFGALKQAATESATGVSQFSTTAEVRAAGASDDTVIRSRKLREAPALVSLTDAATVALDWTAGINFSLTITTDRILGNPSNGIPGQTRTVFVISDGGPDELTFGSQYGGEPPTLDDITTAKGYLLSIYCRTASQFLVSAIDGSPA